MRIALTHAYSWPEVRRGAERILRELSSALVARGHEVMVLTAGREAGRRHEGGVTTVKLRQWRDAGPAHEADFGRRLLPLLAARRFDAVHSMGVRDATAALRARAVRRHRTVYTDLGIPVREWWATQGRERLYYERVVDQVDVFGSMSVHALRLLERNYGRAGVLTPGGVDLTRFTPAPRRSPRPVILFSGAIAEPRKGVSTLLEALPVVARHEPRVELWLSGPGDASALLDAAPPAARDRTVVLGLGQAEAQHLRYGAAWCTALPSTHDSFGQALVESLACGTPIVTSDHAAVPELVSPGTGAVSRAGDPASLADACLAAFALARDARTQDACRHAARPYDWVTSLAPRYERYYAGEIDADATPPADWLA